MRKFTVDCGHRIFGHEGKCANMHGHTYVIEIHARSLQLDSLGRVVDFSVLKEKIGKWLEENWDHGFLYYLGDQEVKSALKLVPGKSFALLVNPTAENLAQSLLDGSPHLLGYPKDLEVYKVVIHETPNCSAEATL